MLKKVIIQFLSYFTLFIPLTIFALPDTSAIHTIKSMEQVEKYVDKETLVLFDLDHTVFEGKHYGYGHANWFYDQIEKGKEKGLNEKAIIFSIFPHWLLSQKTAQVKPVEDLTPALIKKLQKAGMLVIGLSARQVPLVDITVKQLLDIDVDFTTNQLPDAIIHEFHAPTLMKNGIIFCSEYNDKGEVLHTYLDKLNIHPKKIVIIDDSIRHLHAVTKAYGKQAQVIGLHYPLVAESKKKNWNEQKANQAYCHFYKKHLELQEYPLDCTSYE